MIVLSMYKNAETGYGTKAPILYTRGVGETLTRKTPFF